MGANSVSAHEPNTELIEWAYANLQGIPDTEDYRKMISGMIYDAFGPEILKLRTEAHEDAADYGELRLRHFNGDMAAFTAAREARIRKLFGKVGASPYIEAPLYVDYGRNISIGDSFYSNFNLTILDCSVVRIGDRVMCGPNVTFTAAGHPLQKHLRLEEYAYPITVGNDVWIGANVVILPGVSIGDGSVIAAGAVVSRSVGANVVVAGVPARVIREISYEEKDQERDLEAL